MLVGYREQRIDPSLEPRKGPREGESGGPWSSVISVEVVPLLVGGDNRRNSASRWLLFERVLGAAPGFLPPTIAQLTQPVVGT